MLEDADGGSRESEAQDERGVVELVRDDQTVLVDQLRKVEAVGSEPHPEDDGVIGPDELGNGRLQL